MVEYLADTFIGLQLHNEEDTTGVIMIVADPEPRKVALTNLNNLTIV